MRFSYSIDPLHGMAYVQVEGEVRFEDVIKSTIELASRTGFDPTLRVLADLRACNYLPTLRQTLAIASHLGDFRSFFHAPVAVVLPRRLRRVGRLSAWLAKLNGFPLRVFASLDDALMWLDAAEAR